MTQAGSTRQLFATLENAVPEPIGGVGIARRDVVDNLLDLLERYLGDLVVVHVLRRRRSTVSVTLR
jgi:hypothetical protein